MNNMEKVKAAYIKKYPHLQRGRKNNKAFLMPLLGLFLRLELHHWN